ncbi:unnamed protein product [Cuscuta campestris]|uniref:Uncharacterized protein n=1 Tax=Cuscuta campestris TaxID=132261 RepID=A0A484L4S3_9ASTE|nr:unnamed protein product [Cuscuta campestris]
MSASSSPDLTMPSFRLLSDSDEDQPKPHRTQKSLSKRKRAIATLKRHVDPLPSSSSDTDPSWNFWKKIPRGLRSISLLHKMAFECVMFSLRHYVLSKAVCSYGFHVCLSLLPMMKSKWVLKASKGTSNSGGRETSAESALASPKREEVGRGVKDVGLIREKNFVLIRGDADPVGLLHALQLKGEEGEIIYYRKPDLPDEDNQTPDYTHNIYRGGKKTPLPKHFNSSAPKPGPRRPECRLWGGEDEGGGARESYPGHVRESYVAGPACAPKECTQSDCAFHDHYLKSVDQAAGPVVPPPVPVGFYGSGGSGGYPMHPQYGFPQRPPPPPWGYGYGHRRMMM